MQAQQPSPVSRIFPEGTKTYANIPYEADTLQKHLLDIYVPANASKPVPLVVWIHGGAWMLNDKYADMGYMKETIKAMLDNGFALASIDYRHSTTAVFPAQYLDCKAAISFLYANAKKYGLDKSKIAVMGFSAGGHLASLVGLKANNDQAKPAYRIKAVVDFYGPSDFIALATSPDTAINNPRNPVSILLGAMSIDRPDLAAAASPVTYIDANDPPFFIVHGEKDESVPVTQSQLLSSWMKLKGVKNELLIVPGAPHYGEMFDAAWIRSKLISFLNANLKDVYRKGP
ncbi:MAG: alpha/beta hydrolase [Chitinophagaceae bacterium]|nr:MAG: alpha/beta hydrolase [Chitinophagaceae bacterium]